MDSIKLLYKVNIMVFCCEHTRKAHGLITASMNKIIGKSGSEPSSWGETVRTFIPFASLYDKGHLHSAIDDYQNWMRDARESLAEAKTEADKCNCTEIEKVRTSSLREQVDNQREFFRFGRETLIRTENQLQRSEARIENLEVVREQFNNLRIEDARTREEVRNLREENISLKNQLLELKEENLTQKINIKEEKLNRLVFRLNIDDSLIQGLQRAYKLSTFSQTDSNNVMIRRRNIFQAVGHDRYEETERICELCKEIVELQVQLEKLCSEQTQDQQYEALIMVPFRPNIQ